MSHLLSIEEFNGDIIYFSYAFHIKQFTSSTRIIFESREIISQFLHFQQSYRPCILYASETEGVCFGGKAKKGRKAKKTTKKRKNTRDKNNAKQKTISS